MINVETLLKDLRLRPYRTEPGRDSGRKWGASKMSEQCPPIGATRWLLEAIRENEKSHVSTAPERQPSNTKDLWLFFFLSEQNHEVCSIVSTLGLIFCGPQCSSGNFTLLDFLNEEEDINKIFRRHCFLTKLIFPLGFLLCGWGNIFHFLSTT